MFRHRCPWCGNYTNLRASFIRNRDGTYELSKCSACGNNYVGVYKLSNIKFLIPFASILLLGEPIPYTLGGMAVLIYHTTFAVLAYLMYKWTPLERFIPGAKDQPKVHNFATVKIVWYPQKDGGIRWPILNVPSGEIFPACFVNTQDAPITDLWCICLQHIKWKRGYCIAKIAFVLPNPPLDLLDKGCRFYIFHNRRKIAAAEILEN